MNCSEIQLRVVLTMSGKVLVNANRLKTEFITDRIRPVKCQLTLTGYCKNGPKYKMSISCEKLTIVFILNQ